ncbi:sugar ABC transporter substrate-binding protein [Glaciimonas sp. PCH181]|uniref:ABC transporter substrate-binding protein n=1 Tax=Glaciimonas sp. PCH181 TaxID=2133943 RepID=UPI000D3C48A5|nr:sugar ABC transporter substrate-binding protein [Glaciimonas sp. PCH181]PUA19523.1 sugar ABC transporter substrate-binding protein [Glaciimonas sp. PCH181]
MQRSVIKFIVVTTMMTSFVAWAQDKLPYSLKEGKPYAGTTVQALVVVTPQFKGLELRTEEFTKLTGINVKWTEVPFKSLQEKIASVGVAADGNYDVVNYLDAWGPSNANWLLPLDALLKRDRVDMERYPPAFVKAVTFEDKVIGLPMRSHTQLFFYRKDIFDELKLQPPKTWDDVATIGAAIKKAKPGIGPLACYYGADGNRQNLFIWVNYLWGAGAKIFNANGQPAWDSPAAIKATKDFIALNTEHKICADGAVSALEQDARVSFMQGKAAMIPVWWWSYSGFVNPATSILKPSQVAFTSMPSYKGAQPVTLATTLPFGISRYSKHQEAAWEFMKWVSNPDLEKRNAIERKVGGVEIVNNVVNQKVNLNDRDVDVANNGVAKAGAASLAKADVMPLIAEWPEIGDLLSNAISKAASGGDVEQLLKSSAKDAARALRRARR